jgi:hypothetical protein
MFVVGDFELYGCTSRHHVRPRVALSSAPTMYVLQYVMASGKPTNSTGPEPKTSQQPVEVGDQLEH